MLTLSADASPGKAQADRLTDPQGHDRAGIVPIGTAHGQTKASQDQIDTTADAA